ncbi:MAG: PAS domain-containing protein [Halobaculum sp.]
MSLRADVIEYLTAADDHLDRLDDLAERHDLDVAVDDLPERSDFDGPAALDGSDDLQPLERDLVWRCWTLDRIPLGLTLSGPAYQDNPLLYATRTFRELTGYSMERLRGENPRLLQGPDTEPEPVSDLREAIDIWERVTVELRNYRRDGTPFRNRVTLVPIPGADGTVRNWIGVQEVVEE